VLEGDESDGSFMLYDTAIALITNVDADHLDHYGSQERFEDAFVAFASQARECVVAGEGAQLDGVLARVASAGEGGPRIVRFGESEGADLRVTGIHAREEVDFDLTWEGVTYPARITVPGRHHAINAAGAIAVAIQLGYPIERAIEAVAAFGGTKRRFEFKGEVRGVRVFDDYAHTASKARAAVEGARTVVGGGRVIAVHQPHLYSRTLAMSADFARVYEELADFTVVLDVDGAREDPVPGVTGQLVADAFHDKAKVAYLPDWDEAARRVAEVARDGDIVMTLSCGTVYQLVPQLLAALETPPDAS
jgi:UDP-N-acetylmuramate--alanine ligase